MDDQEIVDTYGMLVVGAAELPEGDPRNSLIAISRICFAEFVGMTRYAVENGLIETQTSDNGFQPQFGKEDEK